MVEITPIPGEAAALIGDDAIVVADLHLGIERELYGDRFPSQLPRIVDGIQRLCDRYAVGRVALLGDIKHELPGMTGGGANGGRSGRKEARVLLRRLLEVVPQLDVVKGNHDAGIEGIARGLDNVRVHGARGFTLDGVGLFHGHAWPSPEVMVEQALMGHTHPVVQFTDALGSRITKRCWVRAHLTPKGRERYPQGNRVVIMPAYNELCGGAPFNVNVKSSSNSSSSSNSNSNSNSSSSSSSNSNDGPVGPLLRGGILDMDGADLYLLDGAYLGSARQLRMNGEVRR